MLIQAVQPLIPFFGSASALRLCAASILCGALMGCNAPKANSDLAATDVQVSPEPSANKVALASSIKVRFGVDAVVDTSALVVSVDGVPVDGRVLYSDVARQLSFQPVAPLRANTVYTVTLAAQATVNGSSTEAQKWTFTTADEVGMTPQWVIDTCMTDADIALLAEINRQRLQGGQCDGEIIAPSAALEWQCDLAFIASEHAEDLMAMDDVGAMGSDGLSPVGRVTQAGLVWRGVAENEQRLMNIQASDIVSQTMQSPSQCQTLLDARLSHVGAATALASDGQSEASIAVQLFIQQ
ncbi:MAG: Ig-like domain-containing protein [Marinagarivorans sp.]|nr:Ig-like domain-containing protein [Marinagarivorans sp.]